VVTLIDGEVMPKQKTETDEEKHYNKEQQGQQCLGIVCRTGTRGP
jgi:hypothetical protein